MEKNDLNLIGNPVSRPLVAASAEDEWRALPREAVLFPSLMTEIKCTGLVFPLVSLSLIAQVPDTRLC